MEKVTLQITENGDEFVVDENIAEAFAKAVPDEHGGKYTPIARRLRALKLPAVTRILDERERRFQKDTDIFMDNLRDKIHNARLQRAALALYSSGSIDWQDFPDFKDYFILACNLPEAIKKSIIGIVEKYVEANNDREKSYTARRIQGKRKRASMKIGDWEFPLELPLLKIIAAFCLNEDEKSVPLVSALVSLENRKITESIIWTGHLNQTEMDRAWEYGDVDIRQSLLYKKNFVCALTDKQAETIMRNNKLIDHLLFLQAIPFITNGKNTTSRLSEATRKKLLNCLAERHKQRTVR